LRLIGSFIGWRQIIPEGSAIKVMNEPNQGCKIAVAITDLLEDSEYAQPA
jgi:hypothetical protein